MKTVYFAMTLCLFVLLSIQQGQAQIDDGPDVYPHLWTKVQDTTWIWLVRDSGRVLNRNLVSGYYEFTMQYDSTGLVYYMFTEPWHNGSLLKLRHWELGRSVNLDEDLLSLNSRTEDFTVHTGDTVSFMRDFRWFHGITQQQEPNNFFSHDTLTYVVELASAHDSGYYQSRVAVIDSFGVMPCSPPGEPQFFGSGSPAVMDLRTYVVPPTLDGQSVCMRVRVRAHGDGEYFFTRTDNFSVNMSGLLNDPGIRSYIDYMSHPRFWKRGAQPEDISTPAPKILSVHRRSVTDPEVSIRLASGVGPGPITVAVYDLQGMLLATLFTGTLDAPKTLTHTFTASGSYFISVSQGNSTLQTETIIITR